MRKAFGIKVGLVLVAMTTTLVGGLLVFFFQFTSQSMNADLTRMITGVTRTSAFVFNEEDRDVLQALKDNLYQALPEDATQITKNFAANNELGSTLLLLDEAKYTSMHNSIEFQYTVQLLRRIQEGSRDRINALKILPQTNVTDKNPSEVAWAYLMVPVPDVAKEQSLMFLADSNFENDNVSPSGNPIGNLYRADAFFSAPFKGEVGVSDGWYTDEFGEVMTAVVPIKGENGEVIAALGVDYIVDTFSDRIDNLKLVSWQIFGVATAFAVLMSLLVAVRIAIPLAKLRLAAEQLSKQDFNHIVDIRSSDEFGLLAKTLNQVSKDLSDYSENMSSLVAEKTEALTEAQDAVLELNDMLTQENAHLGAEVSKIIALRGRSLACLDKDTELNGMQVVFLYTPSQSVRGDFWQFMDDKSFCFGHVSGYGLETAMTVFKVQAVLADSSQSVNTRIQAVNQLLLQQSDVVNIKLFSNLTGIEVMSNSLRLMGHSEQTIKLSDTGTALVTDGQPLTLGLTESVTLEARDVELAVGDSVIIPSSGAVAAVKKLLGKENDNLVAEDWPFAEDAMNSVKRLMMQLEEQSWFADFDEDVTFAVVVNQRNT